jgi:hypothetical protein
MHTVELIDEAIRIAMACGFSVRQEWLGGAMAGACQFKGRRWVFVDLALTPGEQLEQLVSAIAAEPQVAEIAVSQQMQRMLNLRRAA